MQQLRSEVACVPVFHVVVFATPAPQPGPGLQLCCLGTVSCIVHTVCLRCMEYVCVRAGCRGSQVTGDAAQGTNCAHSKMIVLSWPLHLM
mmetsp:Transcript_4471/g.7475  ORF Transcript_4471/g.7475 Transcript_4471/m.7475 type:complete len:90 (+) Transcript_4471:1826-2095(+)